jgi:hypothetical protein
MAVAQFGEIEAARAQSGGTGTTAFRPTAPRTSFVSLKQVDAGLLNVGYAEDGPSNGPPVLLLHGWPYDIHSYVDVAFILAQAGYRVPSRDRAGQACLDAYPGARIRIGTRPRSGHDRAGDGQGCTLPAAAGGSDAS